MPGDSEGTAGQRSWNSQGEGSSHRWPQSAQQEKPSFFTLTMGEGPKNTRSSFFDGRGTVHWEFVPLRQTINHLLIWQF